MPKIRALVILSFFALAACNSSQYPPTSKSNRAEDIKVTTEITQEHQNVDVAVQEPTPSPDSMTCPWDIPHDSTVLKYKEMGVEVTLDCSKAADFFQMNRSDIEAPLRALEKNSQLFEGWKNKPNTIRIGGGPFHNSKDKIIQIPVRLGAREEDFDNLLQNLKALINFEVSEFKSEVRISYLEYHLAKKQDGTLIDIGAGGIFGSDPETLKKDFEVLKKYKAQVLSLKKSYPNIVLYHGNNMGLYRVNNWDKYYIFSPEVSAADQTAYFKYLEKYDGIRKSYGPINLQLHITGYPDSNFPGFNRMLNVADKIKDSVLRLDPQPKSVSLQREIAPTLNGGKATLLFQNDSLTIENVMGVGGDVVSPESVKACIEKADFSKPFRSTCDL